MSSLKARLFMAFESLLRVPPLLIVDEIFRISFGIGHANKYGGGYLPPQKTVYIPDKLELSEAERLETIYTNETVSSGTTSPTPLSPPESSAPTSSFEGGLYSSFPVVNELWQVIADALYHVFNLDDGGGSSSSTSTIVEDASTNAAASAASSSYRHSTQSGPDLVGSSPVDLSTPQMAADLMRIAEFIFCISLFVVALITFMLATENLIKLYTHLLSFFTLYLSFIFTPFPTALALQTIPSLLYNVFCRSLLAVVYYACRGWPGCYTLGAENTILTTLTEFLLFSMFFVSGAVKVHPVLYVIIMVGLHHQLIRCFPDIYAFLKSSWNETKRVQNEYGLSHLIQVESGRLRVNTVFRLFWITRAAYDAISKCCDEPLNSMIRYVMTHGTETFTGIVGLTVTVSAICHHIGEGLLFLLYNGANTEADANRFGSISTVLFFILSLQTGLTSLDPEKRLDRLMKNIVLLGTALFHALHQMIAPVLTAFRAFQTLQIRAAVLSCSFFLMSGCLTYYLLWHSTLSTWSLAVLALAIEFKIKIFISLLISFVVYLSQLVQYPEALEKFVHCCRRVLPGFIVSQFDKWHDQLSHEDVVFYLRSIANVAEFLTGIFLFANAVWIFMFESASAIRAIGMSVHAYFNIWCEAHKGYRIYCQRKTASQKIMSLADATDEQLRARQDDVCAVCYEEMESAKVTNCNHLFHAVCLRKWLYVQNTCPLCHEVLYREDALETGDNTPLEPVEQQQPQTDNQNQPNGRRASNGALSGPQASTSSQTALRARMALSSNGNRRSNSNDGFEMVAASPSDDNDTEPESSTNNNNHHQNVSSNSHRGSSSSQVSVTRSLSGGPRSGGLRGRDAASLYYNGVAGRFFEGDNGNSSSGTEYTVDDGSDGDWAEEFSSSDDDDIDNVRRARERGDAIGVPLLL